MENTKKPLIVKAPEGCEDYLTPGKEYECFGQEYANSKWYFWIKSDNSSGELDVLSSIYESLHLNFQDWIVVKSE